MEELLRPSSFNWQVLAGKLSDISVTFGTKLLAAIVVFLIGRWIVRRINRLITAIMQKRGIEPSLFSFLKSLVGITLNFILIIIIISILGIETSSFIALFASAGVAIGMALSGTLQNFAGGVMILLFKPFKIGDFIEAQGQSGTVQEIQIFNTILTTGDNKTIIIPNGGLSTSTMINYSKAATRRVDWTFAVAYGEDYDKAKAVIGKLVQEDARVLKDPACFIALNSLEASAVTIVVRAWVKAADYGDLFFDMNEKVYKAFAAEKILRSPLPHMEVRLQQN
ncbi:MAG: mechanosensitive ion channel [Culturomica sp.]|jgi:small conductance mechanosensitive channel|nr:mechanosensitive ion channel [Culturomica sp.]